MLLSKKSKLSNMKSASINSDFFVGARMSRAENRNVYKIHERRLAPAELLWAFEHGTYVQDVRYADFA